MSGLEPEKFLEINELLTSKQLPLAVVIQKGNNIKVYRIEKENDDRFFDSLDNPMMPSFESVEATSKKLGKEVSHDYFKQTPVAMAQSGYCPPNKEFVIYRARFEQRA